MPKHSLQSFKEQLPSGALLFHAFNDNLVSGDTFNYKKSKPNTGSLSVAAWKDPSFIRTQDPFHSFMVWGGASAHLKQIDDPSTFGSNSVFAWLHHNKAKMLIIDLPLVKSFTFVHYCEEKLKVGYRKHVKHDIHYINENGVASVRERLFFSRKYGYSNFLDDLEKRLLENGIIQMFFFNKSQLMLVDLDRAYNFIVENIYPHNNLVLCKFSYKARIKDVLRRIYHSFKSKTII
jgi:aminoglycoside N3'-acetyltransferase